MAAKRLRPGERLLDLRAAEGVEGYEVHSRRLDEAPRKDVLTDAPPSGYVERMASEHGEVRVAPAVDALLRKLRARRAHAGKEKVR